MLKSNFSNLFLEEGGGGPDFREKEERGIFLSDEDSVSILDLS